MAWETRRNDRLYFYSSRNGKKQYIGASSSPLAQWFAAQAERSKLDKGIVANKQQADLQRLKAFDQELNALRQKSENLIHAALRVAGFRRYRRSDWRRSRNAEMTI